MNITKAIIPVAGWGTRRLPITKTIEKCMLPIGNRPLVDYVVQDCLQAGITELIFVVGEDSTQLQDYYRSNIKLNDYLRKKNKADMLELVAPLEGVKLHFVVQPTSYGKYGTAVPVALASQYVNDRESVVVLMGDDFIWNRDGSSEVQRLMDATPEGECGLVAVQVGNEDVSRYGVIVKNDDDYYERIVEKPAVEDAPSNLINPSKYILTKDVLELAKTVEADASGEYYIIDAINSYVQNGGRVKVHQAVGEYLDGGSLDGWLHANNVVAGTNL